MLFTIDRKKHFNSPMKITFFFCKFIMLFVLPVIANANCTNTAVTICWYQNSGGNNDGGGGNRACWQKAAGINQFKVKDVGADFYDYASSIFITPAQSGSVVTYCDNVNFGSCQTLPTGKYSWFDSHNDRMKSWKFTCPL